MKKMIFVSTIILTIFFVPITSFAQGWTQENDKWVYYESDGSLKMGWFNDIINSAWYYFDENGIMVTNSWIESDGGKYYLSDDGKMLVNSVTPDGIYVNRDGAATDVSYTYFDNVKEDSLSFIKDGMTITVPCKIYYNNERVGAHTTLRYDSVGIEAFNGISPNLIVTYTTLRTGGYSATYVGLDVYVNGFKKVTLGGVDGNIRAIFNKNYFVANIPSDILNENDFVEIYINQ